MWTRTFAEIGKEDAAIAGGKGASLGEMTKAGIPVPPGFVVVADSFDRFLEETDLAQELDTILHSVEHDKIHTVEAASEKIKALILAAEMPQDIAKKIAASFKALGVEYVAVRSSATAEDGAAAAWAGQLETYLNTTETDLLKNVQRCWASLFTPRAIFYRFEKGMHGSHISVAVVVQKMVESENSGIAFSVHPVTEDYNQLIIEAGFGLGEAIVSGQVTPDSYVVEKEPRQIIDINVATQTRGLYRGGPEGNEWRDIVEPKASSQVLSKAQILELSELVLQIEKHHGFPCDIEWAFEEGKFYITQSRPITTLSAQPIDPTAAYLNGIDWDFYLRREQPLFVFAAFAKTYGPLLERVTGIGFRHQLHYYEKGFGTFYRSKTEMQKINAYFANLLDKRDARIYEWLDAENAINEEIKSYELIDDPAQLIKKYLHATLFNPTITYRLQAAFEFTKEPLPQDLKEHIEETRTRSFYPFLVEHVMPKVFRAVAAKLGVSEEEATLLSDEEMLAVLQNISTVTKGELQERSNGCFFFLSPSNSIHFFNGDIRGITVREKIKSADELRGNTAYKGIVRGVVKVVNKASHISKVEKNDILVSINTNPSLMPAVKKAAAIVTDEGGITCHAAIISRELQIPCIIGTKIATQVLKDGDMVEVDADAGIVRILQGEKNAQSNSDIIEYAKKTTWHADWEGPYVFVDVTFSSHAYFDAMPKLFGATMTPIFFVYKNGIVTAWFPEDVYQSFAKHVADKCLDREWAMTFANRFKELGGEILQATKISPKEFLENLETLAPLYDEYGAYQIAAKAASNALPPGSHDLHMLLEDARKYSEKFYGTSAGLFSGAAEYLSSKHPEYSKEAMLMLSIDEVRTYLKEGTLPDKEVLEKRYVYSGMLWNEKGMHFLSADEVNEIEKHWVVVAGTEHAKGVSAYPGLVKGVCRIIRDYKNAHLEEGEILVTGMTDPNFVPLMKKAVAIVTDGGGTLSHAAIVARELKKPCVIGTRFATQIFKNGDTVEVDAGNGIVRILKRHSN